MKEKSGVCKKFYSIKYTCISLYEAALLQFNPHLRIFHTGQTGCVSTDSKQISWSELFAVNWSLNPVWFSVEMQPNAETSQQTQNCS